MAKFYMEDGKKVYSKYGRIDDKRPRGDTGAKPIESDYQQWGRPFGGIYMEPTKGAHIEQNWRPKRSSNAQRRTYGPRIAMTSHRGQPVRKRKDLTEFLGCVKENFPEKEYRRGWVDMQLNIVKGKHEDGMIDEIAGDMGGFNIITVPVKGEAMLKGGYRITSWGSNPQRITSMDTAPFDTSPRAAFLAFWRFKSSPEVEETVRHSKDAAIATCNIFHSGGKSCCEQMGEYLDGPRRWRA